MDGSDYFCKQTNFDTALRYDKLDMWAKFPDFETRIRDAIVTRQALDRITIGFNGTSAADQTDRAAHPLLQDVNKGWLQKMREDSPARPLGCRGRQGRGQGVVWPERRFHRHRRDGVACQAEPASGLGASGPGLVVIVGDDLIVDKYGPIMDAAEGSLDTLAKAAVMADRQLGGLPPSACPTSRPMRS
jgi:hypothetical protein